MHVPATVVGRLARLDRSTGRVVRRYERATPGDLVHLDVKKLGRVINLTGQYT